MNKAPSFNTTDNLGNQQSLDTYQGSYVLLYFYPKDNTPGCTLEALGFQERHTAFLEKQCTILGISKDSKESHQKFCDKYNLDFPLLLDTDGAIAEAYGVLKEKSMFGKKYLGINRESFLINPEGYIEHHWEQVNPITHPQEVLEYLNKKHPK